MANSVVFFVVLGFDKVQRGSRMCTLNISDLIPRMPEYTTYRLFNSSQGWIEETHFDEPRHPTTFLLPTENIESLERER